jgi:hypothetical protein
MVILFPDVYGGCFLIHPTFRGFVDQIPHIPISPSHLHVTPITLLAVPELVRQIIDSDVSKDMRRVS